MRAVKLISVFFLIFIFKWDGKALAQCNCNFTITPGNGTYVFDGLQKNVQPGDTICIAAGYREKISFTNLVGAPNNYIIIVNCGGVAEIGSATLSNNSLTVTASRYFRITGTGSVGNKYGIKILGSKPGSQGILITGKSSDVEIDHTEITNVGFAGMMMKDDPRCNDPSYERPNFTMYNLSVHDNYIHDIVGEGLYMGNSFYDGTTVYCGVTQYPHEIKGVRVFNNLVKNSGWESLQIGSAVDDVEIYNNTIYNYGVENKSSQNGGIQIGKGTTGKLYNNFIKGGTGAALVIQGIGENYVYNNIIVNPGGEAINVNTRPTPLTTDIVATGFLGGVYLINNTIIGASLAAFKEYINNAPGNVLYNNLIVNSASNWDQLKTYYDWDKANNLVIPALADAYFTDSGNDDYSLLSSSPAIDAGKDVSAFGIGSDFSNNARPSGVGYDVGAHEFAAITTMIKEKASPNTQLTVYPNPAKGKLTISGHVKSVKMYSLDGKLINLELIEFSCLDVSALPNGVYILEIYDGDITQFKKVSILHEQ